MDRRALLKAGGGALALTALDLVPVSRAFAQGVEPMSGGGVDVGAAPFTLGVASGDPLPRSVVLWTRLAADPFDGGGTGTRGVPVGWEIAADEHFRRVVQRGTVLTGADLGHSVHVEVQGLRPARTYWYRFQAGGAISPVGRTRTAPPGRSRPRSLSFAFASCQQWQRGYYTAYRHMAEQDLDLVIHLGDYIYEGTISEPGATNNVRTEAAPEVARSEPFDLASYRNRYALYKLDGDLQAAHAAFPFVVTWDDHEVENNYAGAISQVDAEPDQDPAVFLQRRAAAYQAWYEHMPVRSSLRPTGPDLLAHRRLRFGDLAEVSVLDTRQYRSDQACGGGVVPRCDEVDDPTRTITGPDQESWLLDGLAASRSRWKVLAQQVFVAPLDFAGGPEVIINTDGWDGYPFSRDRLLGFIAEHDVRDVVVLTGDIHTSWVNDLKADFADPASATLATEFVGTSISSDGDGSDTDTAGIAGLVEQNPHIKFFSARRGFVQCELTRREWRTDFQEVPYVSTPGAPLVTRASFVVESGRAGAEQIA
jgi:alkaline phosphatase D